MKKLVTLLCLSGLCYGLDNAIRIYDTSGSAQTNRPITVLMVFVKGEFPAGTYPKPRINGVVPSAWQTDVKSTWPDGSVLSAFVSFQVSLAANGNVKVDFVPDANACHLGSKATCEAAALAQAGMLNFMSGTWSAQIRGTADVITYTTDARTMLTAGAWRYWLRGPVVTRVIVEDMTPALAYDFGWQWDGSAWQAPSGEQYKGIHPMFELSFYPGWSGVEVGYKLEAPWRTRFIQTSSGGLAAFQFKLEFLAGGYVVYSKTNYTLTNKGAVSYLAWSGTAPGEVFVDRNLPYLVATRILPPYDLNIQIDSTLPSYYLSQWPANVGTDDQSRPDPRSCTTQNPCAYIKTDWPGTGDHPNFGIVPAWQIAYLYAMGDSRFGVSTRKDMFDRLIVGSAEAALTAPIHTRESYTSMSPALRNYLNWPTDQSTPSFGRIFSITAQYDSRSFYYENTGAYPAVTVCTNCPATDKPWVLSVSHYPSLLPVPYLLTGRYVYLSSLQQWGATILGSAHPEYDRHYDWGIHYNSGEPRLAARPIKAIVWAWLLSPDSPERDYFAEKLKNIDAAYEGVFAVTDGLYASQVQSNCAGTSRGNTAVTFNSSHPITPPNGQRRVFAAHGWSGVFGSVSSVTVNGVTQTVGVYGVDTGRQWYYIPGYPLLIQDSGQVSLSASDTLVVNYTDARSATPWCFGAAMRRGLNNPLPVIGSGYYHADLTGVAAVTQGIGTSPWMVSYLAITLGWARQTRALAVGNGYLFERSAAKFGLRYVNGALHEKRPILYDGGYRAPTTNGAQLIQTWDEVVALHNPPAELTAAIGASDAGFTVNCNSGTLGCSIVGFSNGATNVVKIENEFIRICSSTASGSTTTYTVCSGGRGYWGSAAASHAAGTSVDLLWRATTDLLRGHTYPNLMLNALALYDDIEGTWGSGRKAYEHILGVGTGLELRAGDQRYALIPRSMLSPSNVRAWRSGSTIYLSYTAPTPAACRTALNPTDLDDTTWTSDGGGVRDRTVTFTSAASARIAVSCSFGREYVQVP